MTDIDSDSTQQPARAATPTAARVAVNLIGPFGLFVVPAGMILVAFGRFFLSAYTIQYGTPDESNAAVVASWAWMIAAGVLIVVSAAAIVVLRAVIHTHFLDATIWSFVGLLMSLVAVGLWRLAAFWIDTGTR